MSTPSLKNLKATAHPDGNRIDLAWELVWEPPEPARAVSVRVMRREDRFPSPDDWMSGCLDCEPVVISKGENLTTACDRGLKAETVYYYGIQIQKGKTYACIAAMATGPYGMARQLYDLLPSIYRRYDAVSATGSPQSLPEVDRQHGSLRRFLDLPGGQLDQLYSFARAALQLHDPDRVDGRLLPLLAEWIGWRTDFRRGFQAQRNELRQAPYIQETIGTLPNIEATVKRLIGWDCRAKEFVNNIFISNQPERLNLWTMPLDGESASSDQPVEIRNPLPLGEGRVRGKSLDNTTALFSPELLSLDFAYEGRPSAAVCDEDKGGKRVWLFYHSANANDGWAIHYKTRFSFPLDEDEFLVDLEQKRVSHHWLERFHQHGLELSLDLSVEETVIPKGRNSLRTCRIKDRKNNTQYEVRKTVTTLTVQTEWSAGKPLQEPKPGRLNRHPTAVYIADELWIFWDVYDSAARLWSIEYCRYDESAQQQALPFPDECGGMARQRRSPHAVAYEGELWLFWQEQTMGQWRMRHTLFSGGKWLAADDFEKDTTPNALCVKEDFFAVSELKSAGLRTFWVRQVPCGTKPGQNSRRLFQRLWAHGNWEDAEAVFLASYEEDFDDCEPAAYVNQTGGLELFWSSNRDGAYSIWRSELDQDTGQWNPPNPVKAGPYNQRSPLPLTDGWVQTLVYRSSAAIRRTSSTDTATYTLDTSYTGCTTVDTRNRQLIDRLRQFEDFTAYTYDTGPLSEPDNTTWYSRDTVGVYLRAETDDGNTTTINRQLAVKFLKAFLPIQTRLVFIIETRVVAESIYSDENPLHEETSVTLKSQNSETYEGLKEDFDKDLMIGWAWIRAWTINPSTLLNITNNIRYRTWQAHIRAEEETMEYPGAKIKGFYRDQLFDESNNLKSDSGWKRNTIMASFHVLLARLIKHDSELFEGQSRKFILRLGEWCDDWGNKLEVEPDNEIIDKPYAAIIEEDNGLVFDKNDIASNKILITATINPALPKDGVCRLGEFALYIQLGQPSVTQPYGYIINHVRHPVISKAPTDILIRQIQFTF